MDLKKVATILLGGRYLADRQLMDSVSEDVIALLPVVSARLSVRL
jgi:hypothetical protein